MKFSTAASVAVVAVSGASAQGVSGVLTPTASAPAGCVTQGTGQYQITVVKPSAPAKRDLVERQQSCDPAGNSLIISLNNGVLTDSKGRIGAIVANRQFQFDGPPAQTGSIYTGGFSICGNSSIAIGGTTEFYQCLSGEFYNLYDQSTGEQCSPVRLNTIPCGGAAAPAPGVSSSSAAVSSAPASQATDGQPQASSATSVVSQQSDGQPTAAPATTVVSQISDGQIQGPTAPVVSQISDGQPQATAATNATITTATPSAPIATGGAALISGSGAVVGVVAIAAFFL